jgi:hypothetical protein
MNTCTSPTCNVKTVQQGPWFLLTLDVKIPRDLSMRDHAKFSFDREFAGLSPRGIPLSVKGSSDPAAIGTIPLVQEKPTGWREFPFPHTANVGFLVLTASPRLAFFGIRGCLGTSLCIHPDDLATIVEIPDQRSHPQPTDVSIAKFTPEIVNLLARHTQLLKVVLLGDDTYVRVPTSLRLSRTDWAVFKRHLFTGNSSGTLLDTTITVSASGGSRVRWHRDKQECFKLPGHSLDEVKARWGVGGTKPCGYDGQNLCFESLHVLEGAKLGQLYPNSGTFQGRRVDLPQLDSGYAFSLREALAADIVPANGILHIDPSFERIRLSGDSLQIGDFKGPVHMQGTYVDEPSILCSSHLVPEFLIPARQAVRTYSIPRGITPFRVRTQNAKGPSDGDPSGKYYLLTDLQNLAPRDLKSEREERRARHDRLVQRYGNALPRGYETLTDAQIALYFEIQDLVQAGEIIKVEKHPLMPGSYRARDMLAWIQEEAPHLVMTCPVTGHPYLRRMDGFEDLVDIPGFWHAVESVVGDGAWLRKLITCPKVQVAALISAI